MTHRERVLTAMRRMKPDRTPYFLDYGGFAPRLMKTFKEKTGAEDPAEYFDYDLRILSFAGTQRKEAFEKYLPETVPEGAYVDPNWGNLEIKGAHENVNQVVHHALSSVKTVAEIDDYPLPDLLEPYRHLHLAEKNKSLHERGFATLGFMSQTLFESAWLLFGFEKFLTLMLENNPLAVRILERLEAMRIEQAKIYAAAGVDILRIGDDVGTERGMMISPRLFRENLKPRYARVIEATRRVNPNILIFYHSDGDCREIIPDLIEIGVEILNPVQPECMDPAEIKREYGKDLAFAGTISTQRMMPFGKPDDVRGEVRLRIETIGRGGGLLLAPSHLLQDEVPWENVLTFFDAVY